MTAVVLFILSLGVLRVAASLCERYKISRFLTAGVPALAAWISVAKRTGRVKLRQAA